MPREPLLQNAEDLKATQQCVRSHIFFSYSSCIQLRAKGTFLSLVMFDEVDLIRQDIGSVVLAHLLFRFFFLLVPRWIGVSPRCSSLFVRCLFVFVVDNLVPGVCKSNYILV